MKFLALLMKRPSDIQIRYAKMLLGILLILTGILAFGVQKLQIENSIFGISLTENAKNMLSYILIALGAFPLVMGGLDLHLLSRGRTRILQIIFGVLLIIISTIFVDTATLSVDIFYFLIGFVVALAGITGKAITQKGLKYGQKITKIRV